MLKTKKSVLLIVGLIVAISIFAYYRYTKDLFQPFKQDEVVVKPDTYESTRGVSAVVSYDPVEGKTDTLRFVVTVDQMGQIQNIQTLDAASGEVPEKKKEFNEQINVILKGKKLSELSAIDKVGTSSLTTKAFNEALPELQAAL